MIKTHIPHTERKIYKGSVVLVSDNLFFTELSLFYGKILNPPFWASFENLTLRCITASGNNAANGNFCFGVFKLQLKVINKNVLLFVLCMSKSN